MRFAVVGVVGSGVMASGVAEVCANAGATVIVRSRSSDGGDSLLSTLERSLAREVEKAKRSRTDVDEVRARVSVTERLEDLADCDLVIESIVEEMPAKRALFDELDRLVRPDAILATNTSTLSVFELAMATSRPERVCGMHFFNPAQVMTLVEVVRPMSASDETIEAVVDFARACGKDPVVVKDQPGFVVNALLFPYLNDAVRLLELEVASTDGIDTAMKGGCGFPMGPFALLDLIGLDVAVAILDTLHAELADAHLEPRPTLRRMVSAGHLGRKSGVGFYDYRQ
ncbi:MAG TPA: 3-hydroxyacyl-CoA dehydrogenase NAD-binding domain-containing protein [Acidimicrobiales bacterium]|nr:3-hydroxyacyl-CoA dehydrogenase NAD-binding domain-containing protein [Acidimicrobiales bacterium]